MQTFIDALAAHPKIFNFLRYILEMGFPAEKKAIKNFLRLKPEDKILDLGCGTGEFAPFFSSEQYTGIDIEDDYIEYAKKHYQGNFMVADGTKLPFNDASFDYALTVGVIHHLSDDVSRKILKEAARVLKPDGYMLIMEDVTSDKDGFLTRLIHNLDKGKNIRSADAYEDLLKEYFDVKQQYWAKSGVCPYQIFWLSKKD